MSSSPPGRSSPGAADEHGGQQARARATHNALLLAAAEQFAVKGYHGTSLADVLEATGLTKGALYFHFPSKQALADALIEAMLEGWGEWLAGLTERGLDPIESLLAQTDELVTSLIHNPIVRASTRLMRDEVVTAPTAREYSDWWRAAMAGVLGQAREAGLLRDIADPAQIADLIVAVVIGHTVLVDTLSSRDELWNRVTEFWAGLLPLIAVEEWLAPWRSSGWTGRAQPELTPTRYTAPDS